MVESLKMSFYQGIRFISMALLWGRMSASQWNSGFVQSYTYTLRLCMYVLPNTAPVTFKNLSLIRPWSFSTEYSTANELYLIQANVRRSPEPSCLSLSVLPVVKTQQMFGNMSIWHKTPLVMVLSGITIVERRPRTLGWDIGKCQKLKSIKTTNFLK